MQLQRNPFSIHACASRILDNWSRATWNLEMGYLLGGSNFPRVMRPLMRFCSGRSWHPKVAKLWFSSSNRRRASVRWRQRQAAVLSKWLSFFTIVQSCSCGIIRAGVANWDYSLRETLDITHVVQTRPCDLKAIWRIWRDTNSPWNSHVLAFSQRQLVGYSMLFHCATSLDGLDWSLTLRTSAFHLGFRFYPQWILGSFFFLICQRCSWNNSTCWGHKYASFRWVHSDLVRCHFKMEELDTVFYGGHNFTDYVKGNESDPSKADRIWKNSDKSAWLHLISSDFWLFHEIHTDVDIFFIGLEAFEMEFAFHTHASLVISGQDVSGLANPCSGASFRMSCSNDIITGSAWEVLCNHFGRQRVRVTKSFLGECWTGSSAQRGAMVHSAEKIFYGFHVFLSSMLVHDLSYLLATAPVFPKMWRDVKLSRSLGLWCKPSLGGAIQGTTLSKFSERFCWNHFGLDLLDLFDLPDLHWWFHVLWLLVSHLVAQFEWHLAQAGLGLGWTSPCTSTAATEWIEELTASTSIWATGGQNASEQGLKMTRVKCQLGEKVSTWMCWDMVVFCYFYQKLIADGEIWQFGEANMQLFDGSAQSSSSVVWRDLDWRYLKWKIKMFFIYLSPTYK